ncbi:MAG: ABC-2 family transporter protein [Chloroflexi bacterium]|nr:ABC-2 family transporter protein [Chloroflexota bacterium]
MRSLGLLWLSFRLGALNAIQYRADFMVQLFQSLIGLGIALGGIAVVFSQTDQLGGWRQEELIALIGVFMLVGGLIAVVIRPSMEQLMEGVRLGTLDFTLTKPADAQVLVSVKRVEIWRLVEVVLGAALIVLAMVQLGERVSLERVAAFAVTMLAGVAIVYSFLLILSTLAFWLVRLENILVIFHSMYEAGRWPVGIYPPWLRATLTFVVPVAFAITVPVEALVGRLEPATLVGSLLLAVAFLIASRWFWRLGLRHYTGASA